MNAKILYFWYVSEGYAWYDEGNISRASLNKGGDGACAHTVYQVLAGIYLWYMNIGIV